MKIQIGVVSLLAFAPVANAAWAGPFKFRKRQRSSPVQSSVGGPIALHLAGVNATGNGQAASIGKQQQKEDVDPTAFVARLDRELSELQEIMGGPDGMIASGEEPKMVEADQTKGFRRTPMANSNKKKAFGDTKKQKQMPSIVVQEAEKTVANRVDAAVKTPRDLIRQVKKAKEEKVAKDAPPKPGFHNRMSDPVSVPYVRLPKEKKEVVARAKPTKVEQPEATNVPSFPYLEEKRSDMLRPKDQSKATIVAPDATPPRAKKEDMKSNVPSIANAVTPEVTKAAQEITPEVVAETTSSVEGLVTKELVEVQAEVSIPTVSVETTSVSAEFMGEIQSTLLQKKLEFPTMSLPKMEIPKMDLPKMDIPVNEAVAFAQKAASAIKDTATMVSKDGVQWVLQVRNSLNTTRVDDLDMTYEEALHKVAKGGRGLIQICSFFVELLKETATLFADELPTKRAEVSVAKKGEAAILPQAAVVTEVTKPKAAPKPTAAPKPVTSYLDRLENMAGKTMGDFLKQDDRAWPRIDVRDIKIPRPAVDEVAASPVQEEVSFVEMQSRAAEGVSEITSNAAVELKEIKSKAGSFFGNFLGSASSLIEDIKAQALEKSENLHAKAKEASQKLQKSSAELQKKIVANTGTGKEAPKMVKTHPVGRKMKSPAFFLDPID